MQGSRRQSAYRGYVPVFIVLCLCFGTLLFNVFTFAALSAHPVVGKAFRQAVIEDSPVVASYVVTGEFARQIPGLDALGDGTAAAAAAPLADKITAFPAGAAAVFFGDPLSSAQGRMLWARRLQPYLVLVAAIMWWRRPRPVHLRQRLRA
jgi:hypothetical protein